MFFVHLESEARRATWWTEHLAHVKDDVVGLMDSTGGGAGRATPTGQGILPGATADFDEDDVLALIAIHPDSDWHMMSLARPTYGPTVRSLPWVRAATALRSV